MEQIMTNELWQLAIKNAVVSAPKPTDWTLTRYTLETLFLVVVGLIVANLFQ